MKISPSTLVDAFLIDIEAFGDDRGFFARTSCFSALEKRGINGHFVQQSISWNPYKGTLRGLHYQVSPHEEDKLIRVTRGAIYDVIVDLRPTSSTYKKWFGVELSADNHRQLYVPKGFAHGFQTLEPETEVFYQMTVPFEPQAARGIRWNDPTLGIKWPLQVDENKRSQLSQSDANHPFFDALNHE
jgi:dTDP-4-dehydrorhamnose 3,5-epimerase